MTESNADYITLKQSLGIEFVKMDISHIPKQLLNENENFKFTKFDWADRSEPQASTDAMKHLEKLLQDVVVFDEKKKKRDLFGTNDFTLYDVNQSNQIGFSLGATRYSGK